MMKKYKLLISLLACLIPGAVSGFLVLPHLQWYERRSATVQLILKGGFFTFISLLVFILIFFVWRWVERVDSGLKIKGGASGIVDLLNTTAAGIKERLPDLAAPNEAEKPRLSSWF